MIKHPTPTQMNCQSYQVVYHIWCLLFLWQYEFLRHGTLRCIAIGGNISYLWPYFCSRSYCRMGNLQPSQSCKWFTNCTYLWQSPPKQHSQMSLRSYAYNYDDSLCVQNDFYPSSHTILIMLAVVQAVVLPFTAQFTAIIAVLLLVSCTHILWYQYWQCKTTHHNCLSLSADAKHPCNTSLDRESFSFLPKCIIFR